MTTPGMIDEKPLQAARDAIGLCVENLADDDRPWEIEKVNRLDLFLKGYIACAERLPAAIEAYEYARRAGTPADRSTRPAGERPPSGQGEGEPLSGDWIHAVICDEVYQHDGDVHGQSAAAQIIHARLLALGDAVSLLMGYALTSQSPSPNWLEGMAERINLVAERLGDPDRAVVDRNSLRVVRQGLPGAGV